MEKVSYKAIVNNIPYLAFVALLCVLYISNSHRAIEMQRELNTQNKVLKELRWKYMDVKSQLMYVKTETQVMKNAERIGLKPSLMPAYKVEASPRTLRRRGRIESAVMKVGFCKVGFFFR